MVTEEAHYQLNNGKGSTVELKMTMALRPVMRHELRAAQIHPLETLMRVWQESKHYTVAIGDDRVEFVVCDQRYLHLLDEEEHYGLYVGGMIFVSTRTPERWFPFVVLHEWLERKLDPGTDECSEKHEDALYAELRAAGAVIEDPEEFRAYLYWRRSVERTRYFEVADPEVRTFFDDERRRGVRPPDISVWTRRSLAMSQLAGIVGFEDAHALGATHAHLLLHELTGSSIPVGDLHAIVAATAHVEQKTEVLLPCSLAETIHALSSACSRPVLRVVREEGKLITVAWKDGNAGRTLRAMSRRLAFGQERTLVNGTHVPIPDRQPRRHAGSYVPPAPPRPRVGLTPGTRAVIRDTYGNHLVRILRKCTTGRQLGELLDTMNTRFQARFRPWLADRDVLVPAYAREVDLLPLGTIAALLTEAGYPIERIDPEVLPLDRYRDPRTLDAVVQDNIELWIALLNYRAIDVDSEFMGESVADMVRDHCDFAFDAVPWLVKFLTEEHDDEDGEEGTIIRRNGTVDHELLKYVLRTEYEIDLDVEAKMREPIEETPKLGTTRRKEEAVAAVSDKETVVTLSPSMVVVFETFKRAWVVLTARGFSGHGLPSTLTSAIMQVVRQSKQPARDTNVLCRKGFLKRHGGHAGPSLHVFWEIVLNEARQGPGDPCARTVTDEELRKLIEAHVEGIAPAESVAAPAPEPEAQPEPGSESELEPEAITAGDRLVELLMAGRSHDRHDKAHQVVSQLNPERVKAALAQVEDAHRATDEIQTREKQKLVLEAELAIAVARLDAARAVSEQLLERSGRTINSLQAAIDAAMRIEEAEARFAEARAELERMLGEEETTK